MISCGPDHPITVRGCLSALGDILLSMLSQPKPCPPEMLQAHDTTAPGAPRPIGTEFEHSFISGPHSTSFGKRTTWRYRVVAHVRVYRFAGDPAGELLEQIQPVGIVREEWATGFSRLTGEPIYSQEASDQ